MVVHAWMLSGCPDDPGGSGSDTGSSTSGEATTNASTTPGTTMNDTSGPGSTSPTTTAEDSSSTAPATTGTSTAADSSTGDAFCTIDLPPSPGCPYQPGPGLVASGGGGASRRGVGELVADEDDALGGVGFIQEPDVGSDEQCSTYAQDCPDGEKCTPFANDGGGSWNATHCTPLADDPVGLGETCTVEGNGVSGVDNCELGAMCWDVDEATNMGYCIELCSCTADDPVCNTPNTACVVTNSDVLALCLAVCNPLDPEACEDGNGCFPVGGLFHCAPDASAGAGAAGDPCMFINACDPGTFCAAAEAVPGCGGAACCSSFCELDGLAGCLAGQECVAWFAAGSEPDACLGEVGACTTM